MSDPVSALTQTLGDAKDLTATEWLQRGDKLRADSSITEALYAYNRALDLDANLIDAYYGRGLCQQALGWDDKAHKNLRVAASRGHGGAQAVLMEFARRDGTLAEESAAPSFYQQMNDYVRRHVVVFLCLAVLVIILVNVVSFFLAQPSPSTTALRSNDVDVVLTAIMAIDDPEDLEKVCARTQSFYAASKADPEHNVHPVLWLYVGEQCRERLRQLQQ